MVLNTRPLDWESSALTTRPLLGIAIDKKLTFKQHIENLCQKAQFKLHALRHIRKLLTIETAKILGNAFIDSHFNYVTLLWMYCRKTLYSKIDKIHQKTLKVIYESNDTYDNLLLQSNTISVCQRHLRFLMTEYIKAYHNETLNLCGPILCITTCLIV